MSSIPEGWLSASVEFTSDVLQALGRHTSENEEEDGEGPHVIQGINTSTW